MLAQEGKVLNTPSQNYSTVMEWFGNGVIVTKTKPYNNYEIDFLEMLLRWKDKNEK